MRDDLEEAVVCVVGLGYVGLPLVKAFSRSLKVIGFDIDCRKVREVSRQEISNEPNFRLTGDPNEINKADFVIICVPTPVTKSKEPDLSYVKSAAETTGRNLKKGAIVILESTIYPGVTEEIVRPILEVESGLECGVDFRVAYSPERINPGDKEHTIDMTTKVVAGMDEETTETIAKLYHMVTPHVFKAKNIRTAEAAKVIENIQRDLNIALMNELTIIFEKMGLSVRDVLDAAATKWNFHRYSPGLVGGHCIPVDPYYLVYKAKELGHYPQVILAGRAINDFMPKHVAMMTVKALNDVSKVVKDSQVLVLGLTYKEDVPDARKSPVKDIIKELKEYGVEITGFDPLLNGADFEDEFGIRLLEGLEQAKKLKADCIIVSVAHSSFRKLKLTDIREMLSSRPVLVDVRGIFDAEEARRAGLYYRTL